MTDHLVLLPEEAAAILRMTKRRFLRAERQGEVPQGMTVGGVRRWYRPALEAWLADGAARLGHRFDLPAEPEDERRPMGRRRAGRPREATRTLRAQSGGGGEAA